MDAGLDVWTLEEAIAEGDGVAVRWTMRGTHTGEYAHPTMGSIPASGHSVTLTFLDHDRIRGGQITEIWAARDSFSLLQQFGALPR